MITKTLNNGAHVEIIENALIVKDTAGYKIIIDISDWPVLRDFVDQQLSSDRNCYEKNGNSISPVEE